MNIFQMGKNEHIQIDKIIEAVETRWLNQLWLHLTIGSYK